MRRFVIMLALLAAAALACNLPSDDVRTTGGSSDPGVDDGTTPSIVIESPQNGAQSYVGGKIEIRVRATDSIGITLVQMRESGRVVFSQESPEPTTDFTALLSFSSTNAGAVTLEVVAYRRTIASSPATITLDIKRSINDLDNPNALDPTTGVSAGAFCTARVRVNNLNLRSGPSTDYPSLTKLGVGETLNVIGRNDDSSWWQIKRSNGGSGWVSAQYVNTEGDCSRAPVVNP